MFEHDTNVQKEQVMFEGGVQHRCWRLTDTPINREKRRKRRVSGGWASPIASANNSAPVSLAYFQIVYAVSSVADRM